jgi:hemoglobin-like flavoprotein
MTPQQIDLVQQTFAQVKPIAATAAALFYDRLFAMDPSLRGMFRGGDMAKQGQMLMSMIGAAVAGLRDLDKLAPVVRQLGARHVGYGVKDEHYATVGGALLWTLDSGRWNRGSAPPSRRRCATLGRPPTACSPA